MPRGEPAVGIPPPPPSNGLDIQQQVGCDWSLGCITEAFEAAQQIVHNLYMQKKPNTQSFDEDLLTCILESRLC